MSLLWIRIAVVLYAAASVCALPATIGSRVRSRNLSISLAGAATAFHLIWVFQTLAARHRFTPLGMHEVQSTLSLLLAVAFLTVVAAYRTASFGLFALPLALLLALPAAIGPDHSTFSSPLVQNGWIFLHVTSLMAAYAALLFSLVGSLLYFLQERRLKNKRTPGFVTWLPPLDTIDRIARNGLVLGFACMTVGLCIGSFIAQEKIGPTYFRDPKVLLSFAMWLLYIVMLLVRQSTGLRGRRAVYLSSAVFLVMLTVWAANLLSSVHRFGQP